MCILIVENTSDTCILWFNRDDSKDRVSDEFKESDTVFYHLDKRNWWTWIGNNVKWEIVALLNNDWQSRDWRTTRWNIVVDILEWENNLDTLESQLSQYNPFQLFYYYNNVARIIYWNGRSFSEELLEWNFRKVMSSSSYSYECKLKRKADWEEIIKKFPHLTDDILKKILSNHYSWNQEITESSIQMKWAWSETLSTSIIEFDKIEQKMKHSVKSILKKNYRDFIMNTL